MRAEAFPSARRTSTSRPGRPLTDALCRDLLEAAGLPENTRQHCEAVSREAVRIGAALNEAGLGLDLPLIRRAGLLHDIGRGGAGHEALGAAWIRALGYEREADIIAGTMSWEASPQMRPPPSIWRTRR